MDRAWRWKSRAAATATSMHWSCSWWMRRVRSPRRRSSSDRASFHCLGGTMSLGRRRFLESSVAGALALARPKSDAAFVQLQGAERPTMTTTPQFSRALPVAKAIHPDTLLALRMNGKPLAPNRGKPARMVVSGWVGDDWVRALEDVQLRADEPKEFYYDPAYRFPVTPGAPGAAIPADQMKPMTKLNVKSIIGSLADGDTLRAGTRQLAGVAFSGEAGIERVELSFDGGKSWTLATHDGPSTP